MRIGLLRHCRVAFHEPFLSTAASYFRDRVLYDNSPVMPSGEHFSQEEFPECYVSAMQRARRTAKEVYDGYPVVWPELVEVKNTPILFPKVALPTIFRKIISRIAWFFNYHHMVETRDQSMKRARNVVQKLVSGYHCNTLLVTHGFFMRCLQHELHKAGFRGSIGIAPHHAKLYVFESGTTE